MRAEAKAETQKLKEAAQRFRLALNEPRGRATSVIARHKSLK